MDGRGVLGLPLRIAIAFLIIALFAPSLVNVAESFRDDSDMAEMRNEADKAESLAEELWFAGKGSTGTVELHMQQGYSLTFGGTGADAWSYSIMKGDSVREKHFMETPDVRFLGEVFTATGSCVLTMECTSDEEGNYGIRTGYA